MKTRTDEYTAHMMVLSADCDLTPDDGPDGVLDERFKNGAIPAAHGAADVVDFKARPLSSPVKGKGLFVITNQGEKSFGEVVEQSRGLTVEVDQVARCLLTGSGNGKFKIRVGQRLLLITVVDSRPTSCTLV